MLETHFSREAKPTTLTKKGFAEMLGVSIDKVNNWFQNRRARVKADQKKEEANRLKNMNMYASRPVATGPYALQADQLQTQPQPMTTYFAINADISPTSLPSHPIESIEVPSGIEPLGSQYHPGYDLGSIPETERPDVYNPNTSQLMQLTMAASAGPSYVRNNPAELAPQDSSYLYDMNNGQLLNDLSHMTFPVPTQDATQNNALNGFGDWSGSGFEYAPVAAPVSTGPTPPQDAAGTVSSEPSPFSNAQSMSNTQSVDGPTGSSVASISSMFSNWTGEQLSAPGISPPGPENDGFDPYTMSQAEVPLWTANGQMSIPPQTKMYLQPNTSSQAILSPGDQNGSRKMSMALSDLETPPTFGDDIYSRRNSSATNLVNNMDNINIDSAIHNGQSSDFESNAQGQPSTIASRRRKRPAALNSATLRSGSYSSGMPSPGVQSDHTLRRIRSSGLPNTGGRVQKPTPGSAQRSPLVASFAEAAASPKFVRTLSGPIPNVGQGGSLAPPTPLTPNEMGRWQSNTVFRSQQPMPEDNSPQSLNVSWPVEQQNGGVFQTKGSPPSTPSGLGQMNQARFANGNGHRDTPPQSAPATQQTFPTIGFMPPPRMAAGFRSTSDLTIVPPKPLHFRRPSLPDTNQSLPGETHMHYPVQATNVGDLQPNYDQFNDMFFNGFPNGQYQQPIQMHQFMVQEYAPPPMNGHPGAVRRPSEPQPKAYIFANQGPHDFR